MLIYINLESLEIDNGSYDLNCGNLVLNIIGITWMIDGRANYCFTEPVNVLLTLVFSLGTSAVAIGLQKGRRRRNMKPSHLRMKRLWFISLFSYLNMYNTRVGYGI
ncbi:hypothetical protein Syun_027874 [Stephania yunnanensis]|uniref:Uncharacterized protein n=1 Tax=Stephania yunnanensis TaxID=152371 RepID=A0AAP0ENN2_9MAGN